MEELGGECVYIRGLIVRTCLPSNHVSAVKDLFVAGHHAEELAVHIINVVVLRSEDDSVEEVFRRWRGIG